MPRTYLFPLMNNGFLQTNEWKKFQIEYVQDSKIVKFMAYREKNMLNSPSFGGKDNYFKKCISLQVGKLSRAQKAL